MGLESFLNGVIRAADKNGEKVRELTEKFSYYSDDRVKDRFKHGSFAEKLAAAQVLKDRGYGSDDD